MRVSATRLLLMNKRNNISTYGGNNFEIVAYDRTTIAVKQSRFRPNLSPNSRIYEEVANVSARKIRTELQVRHAGCKNC